MSIFCKKCSFCAWIVDFYLLCLIKLYKRGEKDMVKNIVNAIVEQMEKENLLNIEMKEYFTYSIAMIIENGLLLYQYYLLARFLNRLFK